MSIPLREYQREALEAIEDARKRGVRRQLVAHATGLGKTVLAAHLMHRQQPGRSLFVVHRDELIRQTVDKLALVDPDLAVGVVQGSRNEVEAPVVVASVATLARPGRLEQLRDDFALCVIDEAHHATAASYQSVLDHLAEAELLLGLTATPQRGDGRALDCFDEITHHVSILDGIRRGYLCNLTGYVAGTDADLSRVDRHGGDFSAGSLGDEMQRSGAIEQIAQAWASHAADRKTVGFTPDVATAYALAEALRAGGATAAAFDGTTPTDDRRGLLAQFHHGQIQVLVNCGVLTEGFDEPAVDCILLARPTQSPLLYQQIVGRGARPYPGKTDCLVLDTTGVSTTHDLVGLASLAGVTADELRPGQSVLEASEQAASGQHSRLRNAARSETVDLFRRKKLNWIHHAGALFLPAGEVTVIVLPRDEDGQRWKVGVHHRTGKLDVLGTELPASYATGIGEDYARQCGSLARTDARWRRKPVSARQRAALGLNASTLAQVRDCGHASDLLSVSAARRSLPDLRRATQGETA